MKKKNNKVGCYIPPATKVVEFSVERGFGGSPDVPVSQYGMDANNSAPESWLLDDEDVTEFSFFD